jgi:hypothetical protein
MKASLNRLHERRFYWLVALFCVSSIVVSSARLWGDGSCYTGCTCSTATCWLSCGSGAHWAEYDSEMCDEMWSETGGSGQPELEWAGQVREDYDVNAGCPCDGRGPIGGDLQEDSVSLETEWYSTTYDTYCNHCLT